MGKKDDEKRITNNVDVDRHIKQEKEQYHLAFFRHPKLDNPQKRKCYYRVEHTPAGVRIWTIN